jgi:RNA polymerase sigma-70 factor (ECF subfamily)
MLETANPVGSLVDVHEARLGQAEFLEGTMVQRLKCGSAMAFRDFVEQYQSRVCRITFGILGNRRDAEEIAQIVFAKIYFSISGFNGRSSLYAWVHRTAVNECYSVLRRRRKQTPHERDAGDNSTAGVPTTLDPRPTLGAAALQRDLINNLLEHMPELDRQLLLLRELEGYSVVDIAQATRLNQKTIKARLFLARQRLARAVAQSSLDTRRTARDTR